MSLSKQAITRRNNVLDTQLGETTLLLAHGFGTDRTVWENQIKALQPRFRVIAFDHMGCGASDVSAYTRVRYNSYFSYAQDLIEVCRTCDVEKVSVVAHSASGLISVLASFLAPELFDRLILIGASARYLNDTDYHGGMNPSDVAEILAFASRNFGAWVAGFAPEMIGVERPDLVEYLVATLTKMRPDIAHNFLDVMLHSDFRPELHKVQHPTWVLQTSSDKAVPESAALYLHHGIPNSTYVELPTTGHLPHISAPELVNEVLLSILQ